MSADASQPGIIAPVPAVARSLAFGIVPDSDLRRVIASLRGGFEPDVGVVGFGAPLVRALGARVPGLRDFPALAGAKARVPARQAALWFFLRGGYYWCPPLARGRLDLSALRL